MEEDEDAKVVFGIQKRICRCCLNSSHQSMMYAPSVREVFFELAGITVESSDGLPQWICMQCLALLRKAVRFRRRILETDSILRDYLTRCAPFPMDELNPELSKYATKHLSETQILQFNTDKTVNGYHTVLQHDKVLGSVVDVPCKMEYEEPIVKLEDQYSDIEDDLPLLELRSNREDSMLEDDGITNSPSQPSKRKKVSKSRKKKKKKYDNESENENHNDSENHDESENQDETYKTVSILEPLESNDPLESADEMINSDQIEILFNENFQNRLQKQNLQKYLSAYRQFCRWKKEKNISSFSENVFLSYFNELDLKNKPPTLLTTFAMLKATLLAQNGVNIGNYGKLKKFLKDINKSYCGMSSKVFTKDDIDKFLKTAPDDLFLSSKVVLIIGICGGCVTLELIKLTVNDLEIHANLILVRVQEKKNRERSFMIPENYSEYVKKYMSLRPKDLEFNRFLVNYKEGNFARMAMGKNKISSTPKEVATFLKLENPEKYSGHAFKKTFYALFDPKKGSANDLLENDSDNESESRDNDSEITNNDVVARRDDSVANSYDGTVSLNDDLANFNDNLVNSSDTLANSTNTTANYDDNLTNSSAAMPNYNENLAKTSTNYDFSNNGQEFTAKIGGKIIKIPKKSSKSYVRAYETFTLWMQENNINDITENIMLDYFKHLTKEFRPSSLWNTFSLLRNTILSRNNVDIKKFENLKQFLRLNIEGFEKRTSKVFEESEVELFLSSAPDYSYLVMKVILLVGISGACTIQELTNLTTDNVKLHNNSIVVKIKEGNNKLRRFSVSGHYYEYVKRYMDLRPKNLDHNRFFFSINTDSNYAKQAIGRNTIRLVPREVASFLVLPKPEAYNAQCFKKTSASLFGTKACTIESENDESESDDNNESDNDDHEQLIEPQNIKKDNESENELLTIKLEPIIKNIKRDNFENHNESDEIENRNEFESIITPQNIKQETIENNTIQDNCTYIQDDNSEIQENTTNTRKNSTKTQEHSIKTQGNSIKIRDNSTIIQDNTESSTKIQDNSIEKQEKPTDTFANLPEKTQKNYFTCYELFQTWMIENDMNSYTENVLLKYFQQLSTRLTPSSLCSKYSMLRVTIKIRNGIDISKYVNVRSFINRNVRGYRSKKSRVFSFNDVDRFLNEAPDSDYLHWKVALIIGISGACKSVELVELTTENVKICGKIITVKLLSTKNKRKIFIEEKYFDIVKKYIDLRPDVSSERFFLMFRKNKCVKQVMGKNTICAIPKMIAKYLNLPNPKEYTGLCFRRTSLSLFGGK